jgi:hypothetical protein
MMIEPVMWCQPQDVVGGRPKEWWTYPVDARQASTPQQTLSKC